MATSDRREQVLRAEDAIINLERSAAEHVSASDAMTLAQRTLEEARSDLSKASSDISELSSSVSDAADKLGDSREKLSSLSTQLDSARDAIGNQIKQSNDQTAARFDALELAVRAAGDDIKTAIAAIKTDLDSKSEAGRKSLAIAMEQVIKEVAQVEQSAAERNEAHRLALGATQKTIRIATIVNAVMIVVVVAALAFIYSRLK